MVIWVNLITFFVLMVFGEYRFKYFLIFVWNLFCFLLIYYFGELWDMCELYELCEIFTSQLLLLSQLPLILHKINPIIIANLG